MFQGHLTDPLLPTREESSGGRETAEEGKRAGDEI